MGARRQGAWDVFAERFARAREWLRRVMPRVALAALALYVVRLLIQGTSVYRTTPLRLVGLLAFLAVAVTVCYYGLKLLVRLKRRLLWRVRRRLIITYLFVGLTPVVLLLLLGALVAAGGSSQAMARVVTVQVGETERQAAESARTLADALLALPPGTGERAAREWLDERAALLRASLPGARVHVWRGVEGSRAAWLGQAEEAHLASASADGASLGAGFDDGGARATLPAWLAGAHEWSGLAFLTAPDDTESAFGTPSVRALARRAANGRSAAVLVTVPVSRALVNRYRENTGLTVRPFFVEMLGEGLRDESDVRIDTGEEAERGREEGTVSLRKDGRKRYVNFKRDQFGEQMPEFSLGGLNFPCPVFLNATDWHTGASGDHWAFVVDWSWGEAGKQFWNNAVMGESLLRMLHVVTIAFVVLEMLALFSAAWMTRAVTGTVHKLYRATESVKRGDFSHRIRTRSRDQLGELALAFNDMSSNIETLLAERVEHERLKREVEIAHEVQAQLFPRSTPALESASMTGECRAALGVAGDYYDYVEVVPGLVAFTLGDVSGKGLSASLVMSNLQAALRAQVAIISERLSASGRGAARPAAAVVAGADGAAAGELPCGVTGTGEGCVVSKMVESINGQLCRATDANRFATLFLAVYDDRARSLRYTNAGHNAPLLVRADGSAERLWAGGTVLGAFDFAPFEEGGAQLSDGDLLVVYSDGITEAQNAGGEEYGEGRLAALAAERRHETVENIRRDIFDDIDRWSGDAERGDDQTLVILKAKSGV
ncbi:MAG: SpoIIE family protein phosphatase [Acidobacteria bacterium]|nr:SpoIIE family protein phosphatase [Acidobacteriota bacterium]